jgi:hypothetical protein
MVLGGKTKKCYRTKQKYVSHHIDTGKVNRLIFRTLKKKLKLVLEELSLRPHLIIMRQW